MYIQIKNINVEIIRFDDGRFIDDGLAETKTLPYITIVQPLEGTYDISIDGSPFYTTEEGGCFITPANSCQKLVHNISPISKRLYSRWAFINVTFNNIYDINKMVDFPYLLSKNDSIIIKEIFEELNNYKNLDNTLSILCKKSELGYRLFSEVLNLSQIKHPLFIRKEIETALHMIYSCEKKDITVEQLAKESALSISSFLILFKEVTGLSPGKFMMKLKLEKASSMILESNDNISTISEKCGFYDQFYFSRQFKKYYGVIPSKYKESIFT